MDTGLKDTANYGEGVTTARGPTIMADMREGHPAPGRAGRCCCSGESSASWRLFESSEERKERLKRYIEQLEQELQGAKERLEQL